MSQRAPDDQNDTSGLAIPYAIVASVVSACVAMQAGIIAWIPALFFFAPAMVFARLIWVTVHLINWRDAGTK